ncbi:hypothetical protein E8E11_006405 [Didymella keratinophila]|nr:hypothetical protein E8E11_006405 [Didymella keratinophila]
MTDIEMMACAPTKTGHAAPDQKDAGNTATETEWLFALSHNGRVHLYALPVKPTQTGATIMQVLRKEYKEVNPGKRWFRTRVVIEDAVISPLCIGDPEAQDYPREVIVDSSTPRTDLTEAFKHPAVLRGPAFVQMNEQFAMGAGRGDVNRAYHAILIKTATSKATVAVVLTIVVLFSIVSGLAVGFWTKDAKIGLAVCAGAIGIFALIQASMFGLDTMRSKTSK